jgi:DNA polymerase-3 subunit gamma/tau
MPYQVLARKYRPQRFADVAGQDHVTRTLLNALSQNRIAHGYIFSGHRGIGKTTIARILAMALNCRNEVGSPERPTPEPCGVCENCREISAATRVDVSPFEESHSFDVEEIDAATNRGIDDARLLTNKIQVRPLKSKYRILILDEAHQITDAAWNSLLKTLEEPPDWAVFMFATTQPEDVPQTIRSRCQHFSFHAVGFEDILAQLKMIAVQENISAEDEALTLLAEAGDGSMRDALSIMDQAIASAPLDGSQPKLSAGQIRDLMGAVPNTVFEGLMESVAAGQSAELMEQVNGLVNAGHSPQALARQLVRYLRNALMAKLGGEKTELLQISADERARATRTAMLFTEEELMRNLQIILRTFDDLNYRQEQRFHLELGLLKLIQAQRLLPIEELLTSVAGGSGARPATPTSAPRASAASARPLGSSGSLSATGSPSRETGIWSSGSGTSTPRAEMKVPGAEHPPAIATSIPARETTPFPAVSSQATGFVSTEPQTEGSLAKAPEAEAVLFDAAAVEHFREAIVAALSAAGHTSAAQLLGTGSWTVEGGSVRVVVPGIGKKMLSLTVNAAAEKIIRQELQKMGAPPRFLVSGGAGTPTAVIAPLAAPPGSVQQSALAHPLVKRAQEIFHAEVRSVVDLREK